MFRKILKRKNEKRQRTPNEILILEKDFIGQLEQIRAEEFNQKIEKLQTRLQSGTGNVISAETFYKYIKNALAIYQTAISQNIKTEELIYPFKFKNICIEHWNWKTIIELLTPLSYPFIFDHCSFSFTLNKSDKPPMGACHLTIENNSKVKKCYIESDFCDRTHVTFNNTIFEDLTFRGKGNRGISESFKLPLIFNTCEIHNLECEDICKFNVLSFSKCNFGKDTKSNSRISFNNAEFLNTTKFLNCKFFALPKFHNVEFHSDTSFDNSTFHDVTTLGCAADYRALKKQMHDIGDEQKALKFHAHEMEARRNTILPKNILDPEKPIAIASFFLKAFNNYGQNYWRPFLWILFLLPATFFLIYWTSNGTNCVQFNLNKAETWIQNFCKISDIKNNQNNIYRAVIYSIQHSFGPLGIILDSGVLGAKTWWIKSIALFQSFLSSILWYLLIVQIRRQFRL